MHEFFFRNRVYPLLVFFVILSIMLITFQIRILDSVILFVFSPVEKGIVVSIDNIKNYIFKYYIFMSVRESYEILRKENNKLHGQLLHLKEIKQENYRLEKLLTLSKKIPFVTLAAHIIGKSPLSQTGTLIIDKGKKDGVRDLQGVINCDGVVGRILGVSQHSAKMQIILDNQCIIAALNQRTRDNGLIQGIGPNISHLKMNYVFYRADFKVDDIIITSGLDKIFPKGLLIGKVIDFQRKKNNLFYTKLIIKPVVKFNKIEEVLVVLNINEADDEAEGNDTAS